MSPLLEPEQKIGELVGYYNCHSIKRNDVVVFQNSHDQIPIIKIVKGVGGDLFSVAPALGGWNILINGKIALNSENKPYLLDEQKAKKTQLFVWDYEGVIPKDKLLVLGDRTEGTLDSTVFGLISSSDVLGKAEW